MSKHNDPSTLTRVEKGTEKPMATSGISRRDVLRTLAIGAAGGGVLQVIPLKAAELAHQMVHKEKAAAPAGKYTPKYFTVKQYEILSWLCDAIIPKDEKSGGALEAGAPEFIDLLTSENEDYQLALGGGLDAQRNVPANAVTEQKGFLRNEADVLA